MENAVKQPKMLDISFDKPFTIQYADRNNFQPAIDMAYTMIEEVYHRDLDPHWDRDLINFAASYLETPGNAFLQASSSGKIAGILAVRQYDGRIEALRGAYDPATTAELARCFILKRARRQGVAAMLVKEAEHFCRECGFTTLYLHTHRFLPGALEFWQAMGFQVRLEAKDQLHTVHLEKLIVRLDKQVPWYTNLLGQSGDSTQGQYPTSLDAMDE